MYDYATVTKQNQIISQLETVNTNIETTNNNIAKYSLLLAMLICIILLREITKTFLGGK